jgi:hypothetical protein
MDRDRPDRIVDSLPVEKEHRFDHQDARHQTDQARAADGHEADGVVGPR